jgi:hypothetical protein
MTTITESQFRALCSEHGSPDDIPLNLLPEKVAMTLSMEDRFFDNPEDVEAAVRLLEEHFYSSSSPSRFGEEEDNRDLDRDHTRDMSNELPASPKYPREKNPF